MTEKDLIEKYGEEKVLVVENDFYESWLRFTKDPMKALENAVEKHGFYMLRSKAELNDRVKQVIPYVMMKCKGKYLVTKRLGGDSRLINQYSIGQGGHIDKVDMVEGRGIDIFDFDKTVNKCIKRELEEETTFNEEFVNMKEVCVFTDDSQDVSKVHICYLVIVTCDKEYEIRETDKLEGTWMTPQELYELTKSDSVKFENWSEKAFANTGLFMNTTSMNKQSKQVKKEKK